MRAAYDTLADETKASLEGLRVHHSIAYSRVTLGFEFSDEESDRLKGAIQPLVLENPRTGRRSIYLASHAVADSRPAGAGWPAPAARPHGARDPAGTRLPAFVARRGLPDLGQPRDDATGRARSTDTVHRREMRRVTTLDTGDPARTALAVLERVRL